MRGAAEAVQFLDDSYEQFVVRLLRDRAWQQDEHDPALMLAAATAVEQGDWDKARSLLPGLDLRSLPERAAR